MKNHGIGMGSLEICRPKGKLHAFFFRDGKALRNPHIIRLHAEKPGDDGPIGAVAFSRGGEGTVHTDIRLHRLRPQKLPCHQSDPCGPRRVGTGWSHHHRTENVKNVHFTALFFYSFCLSRRLFPILTQAA